MNKYKVVVFIVARLNSSRFPKKHFRKIGALTLIDWVIYNLKQSKEIDQIVLATVNEKCNTPLVEWSKKQNISYFLYNGNVDHVTTRLVKAAQRYNADICVLISGDCPLPHAESIDLMIKELKRHPEKDYISVSKIDGKYPAIQGIQVAWKRTWELADQLSNSPELKEHHFPILNKRKDIFKAHELILDQKVYIPYPHRFSIDTWADLEFFNKVYSELKNANKEFSLPNVTNLLMEKPELLNINAHVHQRKIKENINNILMIVDIGENIGYGHLMRSIEIALKTTEYISWPVTFLIQDHKAKDIITNYGLNVIYKEHIIDNFIVDTNNTANRLNIDKFDILFFDLFHKRQINSNWLDFFIRKGKKVIVLDNLDNWCLKAHKIIIPGVTLNTDKPFIDNIVWGKDYIIIRDDIVKQRHLCKEKDIDLLVYIHDKRLRKKIKETISNDLTLKIIEKFNPNFPKLLARSKMFISSFGYSFYEAAFLKSYPICFPGSKKHEKEALLFYKNLKLTPYIIHEVKELKTLKEALKFPKGITIKNGVKNVVDLIKNI